LQKDADYFSSAEDVSAIMNKLVVQSVISQRKQANIEKINSIYNQEKNINDYEQLMFIAASKDTRLGKHLTLSPSLYQTAEKPW
jgi:hypothetical protein